MKDPASFLRTCGVRRRGATSFLWLTLFLILFFLSYSPLVECLSCLVIFVLLVYSFSRTVSTVFWLLLMAPPPHQCHRLVVRKWRWHMLSCVKYEVATIYLRNLRRFFFYLLFFSLFLLLSSHFLSFLSFLLRVPDVYAIRARVTSVHETCSDVCVGAGGAGLVMGGASGWWHRCQ